MVVGFVGNDVSNTTNRVVNIPGESWNYVHVDVEHSLSGSLAYVDADVPAIDARECDFQVILHPL